MYTVSMVSPLSSTIQKTCTDTYMYSASCLVYTVCQQQVSYRRRAEMLNRFPTRRPPQLSDAHFCAPKFGTKRNKNVRRSWSGYSPLHSGIIGSNSRQSSHSGHTFLPGSTRLNTFLKSSQCIAARLCQFIRILPIQLVYCYQALLVLFAFLKSCQCIATRSTVYANSFNIVIALFQALLLYAHSSNQVSALLLGSTILCIFLKSSKVIDTRLSQSTYMHSPSLVVYITFLQTS